MLKHCTREAFLERTGLGLAALTATTLSPAAAVAATPANKLPVAAKSSAEALELLQAGNVRFVTDAPMTEPLTPLVAELASGQAPFAIILGCSDSRVPLETIFDQPPGNVFAVRIAGNFLNADNFGSIEYAVAVLKAKLIVVLGHSKCGAVAAAVAFVKDGTTQPGHIQDLVVALAPAADATRGSSGDWVANAVKENVHRNVIAMTAGSTIVEDAVKAGELEVRGGIYDLHTGKVTFLPA
jgi:carbonic anhydrase